MTIWHTIHKMKCHSNVAICEGAGYKVIYEIRCIVRIVKQSKQWDAQSVRLIQRMHHWVLQFCRQCETQDNASLIDTSS
jgi:hypothetical protein